ncbi:hypothetical protein B4U79_10356 [Dinothrombium tinctorium]|uniref:Uncharacterized protein n=1 Tax=Dinothrombium tinctorium TaxID=1965070 RepID=A0A443QSK0_9ACAR|nr:hypothetical protein B4U79_10356 [Dinothrombium tinctorium]
MDRIRNQPNIIYPADIQYQEHVQHRSLTKILHCTSSSLNNTAIYSSDKNTNRRLIHPRRNCIYANNHLHPPPVKKWSRTSSLMIPRSNGRTKMRKLCTINNRAIGGLNQTSMRKILTYSSINHTG